jgi:hypothetical protein
MKHVFLSVLVVVAAAACSNEQQDSGVKGEPGFIGGRPAPTLNISCVDTKTFADAPGYNHLLKIDEQNANAQVFRREVIMRGQPQQADWEVLANSFAVSRDSDGEKVHLSVVENVNKNIDWSKEKACWKMLPALTFSLSQTKRLNWEGTRTTFPVVEINPAADECMTPDFAQPLPEKVACNAGELAK